MAMRAIKLRLSVAAALLLVASCGGASDEKILTESCAAGSIHSKQACSCFATELKEKLSAEDYDFLVKQTETTMKLAEKTKGMSVEEAMEASKGAAQDAMSDPVRASRVAEATMSAMGKCTK